MKEIDYAAFIYGALESITLEEGIEIIGEKAFCKNDNPIQVTIPGSVRTISDFVFYDCANLSKVTILDGTTYIGEGAFRWGNLTDVVIPESVTFI